MKGRNTFVVSIRFPDEMKPILEERAYQKGLSIGEYIRMAITQGVRNQAVNRQVLPQKKPHTAMDGIMALPEFNPTIHKKGDHVRVFDQFRDSWSRLIVP